MSIFITEQEIFMQGLDNYSLVLCCSEANQPSEYIFGSLLLYLPKSPSAFIQAFRSLSLQPLTTIVCYDNNSYLEASLAYWGFKSLKLSPKILIRSPSVTQTLKVLSGIPHEIPQNRSLFTDIDPKVLITKKKLTEKNKKSLTLQINSLPFNLVDLNGKILNVDDIKICFDSARINLPSELCYLSGKKAPLAGVCFNYIGISNFVVVLEDNESERLRRKGCETFAYGGNGNDLNEETLYFNSLNSIRSSENIMTKSVGRKGSCGNCLII